MKTAKPNKMIEMKLNRSRAINQAGHRMVITVVLAAMFSVNELPAQTGIKGEQVDIVKAYQPWLADAEKIQLQASPAAIDSSLEPLKYEVKSHVIDLPFAPAEIKPLALPKAEAAPVLNNLVKAGLGTQLSPLFEVYLSNGQSGKVDYGANFHFLSSSAASREYQDITRLGGKAFGTSYFKNTALSASLAYDLDDYHFYGFDEAYLDTTDALSNDLLRQRFQNFGLGLGFRNTAETKSDMDYRFRFDYNNRKKKAELGFVPEAAEDYFDFEMNLDKRVKKEQAAGFDFRYQREKFSLATDSADHDTAINYFSLIPNYEYRGKKFYVKAGLNFEVVNEEFLFSPVAEVSFRLIEDYLIPYAGIFGRAYPNSMKALTETNPFLAYYSPATSRILEGYAGVKGSYGNNIYYNARLSYRQHTHVPFYYSIDRNPALFLVNYYYEALILGFYAEAAYKQSERLNLLISGEANSWDLDFDYEPIGIPQSKLTLGLNYNIQQKIFFNAELFALNGMYAYQVEDSTTTELKGRIDLNLSATYQYKKNISFWLSFNNLTAAKQREWYQYPTYGLVAMGGILLKF